jgi:hypothetical protein
VTVRVSEALRQKLDDLAAQAALSPSEVLRRLIEAATPEAISLPGPRRAAARDSSLRPRSRRASAW